MEKDILNILLEQHKALRAHMNFLREQSERTYIDSPKIRERLIDFEKILKEHLGLEEKIFYPQLLKKLEEKGVNTLEVKEFIFKMTGIAANVSNFINKYKEEENIKSNLDTFKMELNEMIVSLLLRIDSEEGGVFAYWEK